MPKVKNSNNNNILKRIREFDNVKLQQARLDDVLGQAGKIPGQITRIQNEIVNLKVRIRLEAGKLGRPLSTSGLEDELKKIKKKRADLREAEVIEQKVLAAMIKKHEENLETKIPEAIKLLKRKCDVAERLGKLIPEVKGLQDKLKKTQTDLMYLGQDVDMNFEPHFTMTGDSSGSWVENFRRIIAQMEKDIFVLYGNKQYPAIKGRLFYPRIGKY